MEQHINPFRAYMGPRFSDLTHALTLHSDIMVVRPKQNVPVTKECNDLLNFGEKKLRTFFGSFYIQMQLPILHFFVAACSG